MISCYTSHINSLIVATLQLVYVAAICNCYSEVVYWQATFLLQLCILEAQWGYHTIKRHDLPDTLFEILEGCRTWSILDQN